jgi:hypothetical protein
MEADQAIQRISTSTILNIIMTGKNIVRLKIISCLRTPQEISQILGLQCDRSWLIGDKRGRSIIVEKDNGWVLNAGTDHSISLETQVEQLLERLASIADKIHFLSHEDKVELSLVIYTGNVIRQLGHMGAGLDIDLYLQ